MEQGIFYYNRFISKFPNLESLATSDEKDVLLLWQGLGYYSRARNLHHTAKHIYYHLDSKFPESYDELINLKGASSCYNPSNPYEIQYVMKGGSFLCHDSYCASYRISARMGVSVDSGSDHTGFRTVVTPEMLLNK